MPKHDGAKSPGHTPGHRATAAGESDRGQHGSSRFPHPPRKKIECGLPAPSPRGHQARADDACTPGFGEPSARLASQRFGSHVFGSQGQVHVALGSQVSCRSPDARSTFSAHGFNALLVRLEVGLIFQQSLVQSLECKFTTAGFHNYSCVIMMKIFRCSP